MRTCTSTCEPSLLCHSKNTNTYLCPSLCFSQRSGIAFHLTHFYIPFHIFNNSSLSLSLCIYAHRYECEVLKRVLRGGAVVRNSRDFRLLLRAVTIRDREARQHRLLERVPFRNINGYISFY